MAEPLTPEPVPQALGGPTQKLGPPDPTVKGPLVRPVTTVLPLTVDDALYVPLRFALAVVVQIRHSVAAAPIFQCVRLILVHSGIEICKVALLMRRTT